MAEGVGVHRDRCVNAQNRQRPRSNISRSLSIFLFPNHHHLPYLQIPLLEMSTSLDHLKATGTVVVSDSGDFECEPVSRFHCFLSVLLITTRSSRISFHLLQPSMLISLRYADFLCSSRGSEFGSDIGISGCYDQPIAYSRCCRKGRIRQVDRCRRLLR